MATICVFGAASNNIDESYIRQTEQLGKLMAEHGHRMIYGAGASGLMGAVARGMDMADGHIVGVAPHFIHKLEPVYDCEEVIMTENMGQRKAVMEQNADAFIIVPGGVGTLDEFFQVLTLKDVGQLGSKPIVLFNCDGYYDDLRVMVEGMNKRGFLRENVMGMFSLRDTPAEVLAEIEKQMEA